MSCILGSFTNYQFPEGQRRNITRLLTSLLIVGRFAMFFILRVSETDVWQRPTSPATFLQWLFSTFLAQIVISSMIFILTCCAFSGYQIKDIRWYPGAETSRKIVLTYQKILHFVDRASCSDSSNSHSMLVAISATNIEWLLPEGVLKQFVSPDDEHCMLETCREL